MPGHGHTILSQLDARCIYLDASTLHRHGAGAGAIPSWDLSWPTDCPHVLEKLGARIGGWVGSIAFLAAHSQAGAAACGLACAAGYRGAGWILWYRKRDTDGSRRLTEPV